MLSLFKRYRDVLIVGALLLYPFVTYMTRGHRGRAPNLVDRWVVGLATPLQSGVTWAVDAVVGTFRGYVALRGVAAANRALADENAQLRGEVNALREAQAENQRLKRLLGYVEGTAEAEIAARVVGVNPSPHFLSLRINRGETDGVRAGMPVVVPDGVVGVVVRAGGGWADVRLVTDPSSRVGALVQRSRVRGTVAGAAQGAGLALQNVLASEEVKEGDVVVTSGTDGVFPRGLVIGRVGRVRRVRADMFLEAPVQPAVVLSQLEELFVLPGAPGTWPSAQARPGRAP